MSGDVGEEAGKVEKFGELNWDAVVGVHRAEDEA